MKFVGNDLVTQGVLESGKFFDPNLCVGIANGNLVLVFGLHSLFLLAAVSKLGSRLD